MFRQIEISKEHKVQKIKGSERSELDGFALWLDRKYDQFLYDSELKNAHESRVRRITSGRMVPKKEYNPSRRGRLAADGRDGGDGGEKCHQSFEVILQPKELSRPASECCFQYKPGACCNSSKATVASSDTVIIKKRSKFNKPSCECQDDELRVRPHPTNVIEVTEVPVKAAVLSSQNISLVKETNVQNDSMSHQTTVQCQCPEERLAKTEISSQYEDNNLNNEADCDQTNACTTPVARNASQVSKSPRQENPSKNKDALTSLVKCFCLRNDHVKIDTGIQYSDPEPIITISAPSPCDCCASKLHNKLESQTSSSLKKLSIAKLKTESQTNVVKKSCNCRFQEKQLNHTQVTESTRTMQYSDAAQTSDHAIVLDNAAMTGGFPLLVRIVTPKRAVEDSN